ncbi:thioesterase family protein [Rarobacter faecitabidus]|uniref:Acyl-CoA thioester hydrolase n=1 Tax=Rarobacter faecitabidus TaxID=13243 RepID=A0A542ZX20_RARFA|nr:thioesterase family protein [Rarobacter faecitabidus]TQL64750.1 acyl-CoA thioester hydrolase [Rarobacter faecitabidus]
MAKLTVRVPVRWSDLDPYGHVNNVAMLTLLEEARVAAFWNGRGNGVDAEPTDPHTAVIGAGTSGETLTFVASHRIEYLAQLGHLAEPARIQLWISAIGGASFDIDYEVFDGETVCARARTTLVLIDPETKRPRKFTAEEKTALTGALAPPLTFRR